MHQTIRSLHEPAIQHKTFNNNLLSPSSCLHLSSSHLKKKILFIYFWQRGREGEREGAKHQCVVASHAPPTGIWPQLRYVP